VEKLAAFAADQPMRSAFGPRARIELAFEVIRKRILKFYTIHYSNQSPVASGKSGGKPPTANLK
ncbi:MAG: hypothetical protein ACREP5_07385, partial [Candidatus Binatia bacterium]